LHIGHRQKNSINATQKKCLLEEGEEGVGENKKPLRLKNKIGRNSVGKTERKNGWTKHIKPSPGWRGGGGGVDYLLGGNSK